MKKTVEEMFSEMIKENEDSKWVNPRLERLTNNYSLSNFIIKLDDFNRIHESMNVSIYNISKWPEGYILHCKQDFF